MKKILSMLAVAAMAFTACTTDITDDVVKNENVGYTVPLEFGVEQEVSRAFMDDDVNVQFENGDEFGIYVIPADAAAAATKNAKGIYNNGTVTAQVASFAAGDKVMVYYPYHTQNNDREATDIILSMPHVQVQTEAGVANLKGMPMVSETTLLENATGGSIFFRPVAAIVKFNIYSDDEKHQGATISSVRFHAEKWENADACNYVTGNRTGFDLTNITRDGEIEVKREATIGGAAKKYTITSTPSALQAAYRANVNCQNGSAVVGTKANPTPVYVCVWPGEYGGKKFDSESLSFVQIWTEKGYFKTNVNNKYEFGRAMMRPFTVGIVEDSNFRASVGLRYAFEHGTVAGATAEQMLNEEVIVIGSGAESKNMFPHKLTDYNTLNTTENLRMAYVQTLDGQYGARLEFFTASNNTLKRGDKLKITLVGTKLYNDAKKSGDKEATSNTNYARIIHFAPENILELTPGCHDEIVVKEKTIAELTDQDVFTEVTLKNMEVVVKQTSEAGTANLPAPFTYGYEVIKMGVYTSMLQDRDNNAIYALFNQDCGDWRRNVGVPQGVGSVKGILVHETSKVVCDMTNGNMGKYQLRPHNLDSFSGISTTAEDATNVLAKWSLLRGHVSVNRDYKFTCDDQGCLGTKGTTGYQQGSTNAEDPLYKAGIVPQNKMWATHGLTDGTALFYSTNRAVINRKTYFYYGTSNLGQNVANTGYPIGIFHGLKRKHTAGGSGDINSVSSYTSLVFHSNTKAFYEWDESGAWTGNTTGFVIELPTTGADKQLAVSFSMAPAAAYGTNATSVSSNNIRHNVIGYPSHWKVECSVDGGNTWTACTNAITADTNGSFDLLTPNVYIHNSKYLKPTNAAASAAWDTAKAEISWAKTPSGGMSAGYGQYKFLLPEAAQNQAKVMIKISPRDLRLAWPSSNAWGASFNSGNVNATSTMTQGCVIAFEDVAVTCAK